MPSTREQKGVHHEEEEEEEEDDDDYADVDKDFNGSFLRVQQHQIHEHYIERSPSCSRF